MIDSRPILLVIGVLLLILSATMLVPCLVDIYYSNPDWQNFAMGAFFTAFIGGALFLSNRGFESRNLNLKQAFILTTASWVSMVIFASLPFAFSDLRLSYTDAFFETMSGLTTTGATVFTGLETMPPGILIWRAILQWLGGIGIIVMAMAILPMLKIGGMQLFRAESSDNSQKILPRVTQLAFAITTIYVILTVVCAILMNAAGMQWFDAICHALTTVATGGFSTHDNSIAYYDSYSIELIMVFFMLLGGIPFVLLIQFLRGRPKALWQDTQVRAFLYFVAIAVLSITLWLIYKMHIPRDEAFRMALFNIVSVITTAGFSTQDYSQWGSFAFGAIFLFLVVGGCTGSTTGGIKTFRFQVLFETAKTQINQLIQPHGVFRRFYNRKPIPEEAMSSVMSFFILFAFCFSILSVALSLTGLDYITSMSAAAAMIGNVGPGLGGLIGPSGDYGVLSDMAKWICCMGMLLGRLEIFTVLILFSPYFWKS